MQRSEKENAGTTSGSSSQTSGKKRGRPVEKKAGVIANKFGVRDKVLMATYGDDDENLISCYYPATIVKVLMTEDATLYTLVLDDGKREVDDVDETMLYKRVEV